MFENPTAFFERALFQSLGKSVSIDEYMALGGGSINQAVALNTSEGQFFIKYNELAPKDMFALEAQGLQTLREAEEIHIPEVLGVGEDFLLLEFIAGRRTKNNYWEDFGQSLARLHRHTNACFGLEHNNYIGRLEQINDSLENGIDFFIEKRLKIQAGKAFYEGYLSAAMLRQFDQLYAKLPGLIPNEKPALLHGDLWSGNVMSNHLGLVALIDPAVYYGLRETEIAFTHMFGGFHQRFYEAYQEAFLLEPGFDNRKDIYNLYPLLVHVNLFGQGYVSGVQRTLNKYCQ
ncbi:MAG TPA: ketosamine-3-kinase [Microscillaceae bacterium]|nr:ketosamine-3-kinase [Microscillaceae bacterium]